MELPPQFDPVLLKVTPLIEAEYAAVVILACVLIFWRTRELSQLTGHRGIQYFRYTFLFFAFSYFFRFFGIVNQIGRYVDLRPHLNLVTFAIIYVSSAAVLYLLFSLIWKKLRTSRTQDTWIIHGTALAIATVSVVFRYTELFILSQILILLSAAVLSVYLRYTSKKKKGFSQFYYIYILLFVFWIVNTIGFAVPRFFPDIKLIVYAVSTTLFLIILYGVLNKTGGGK